MPTENSWDQLAAQFNTHIPESEIDPAVADNVFLAWPAIIDLITEHFKEKQFGDLRALDYGCGTGGFTKKLYDLGFGNTVGTDNSEKMLSLAQKISNLHKNTFIHTSKLAQEKDYDSITGIMVFQFIEDINKVIFQLAASLKSGGLLTVAVFNPKFVRACLEHNKIFSGFKSKEKPTNGNIVFGNISIPTFIRTAGEYDEIMLRAGLTKQLETYPPFTEAFLNKYPVNIPTEESEYLILGYSK